LALKNKICSNRKVRESEGALLQGDEFNAFHDALSRLLPKVDRGTLFQSIRHSVGQTLTPELLQEIAWRLAGNVPRLQRGQPVPPWNRQADEEFVPVQIFRVQKIRRFGNVSVEWSARVLAGTSVGLTVHKTWSDKLCRAIAQRLGFGKPWQAGRYEDAVELFGLRFYVLIEPKLCGTSPGFETIWYDDAEEKIRPGSFYDYNRTIIRMRQRPDDFFPCPQGLPHSLPCRLCVFGQDQCPAATHGRTYTQRRCDSCERDDAYFDPTFPTRVLCVECHQRHMLRRDD
jgi:hypothetical protein